jgi:hypothetical protein
MGWGVRAVQLGSGSIGTVWDAGDCDGHNLKMVWLYR